MKLKHRNRIIIQKTIFLFYQKKKKNFKKLFSSFNKQANEIPQLSDNEKAYLGSVVANDVIQLRNILEDLENNSISFNYDCHDFRGRSALHLAVENENIEIIEMLIDRSRSSVEI